MKVPLSWLRDYVAITLPPRDLAHRLTMAGLAVASIEEVGAGWQGIVVAEIKRVEAIPGRDRVRLAIVDAGQGEQMIVCGAPNIAAGQRVPLATVGTTLGDTIIQRRHFGGRIYSEGMLCSPRELGLSDDHSGILQLPASAPLGAPLQEVLGEVILDVEVSANRSDWLSLIGVAREVAALTDTRLRLPDLELEEAPPPAYEEVELEIADPALCGRYTARIVRGVRVGPSPEWMQRRLLAAGMRPINNVVDVTNYVMLEWGQPLHAFDCTTLRGLPVPRIAVRPAAPGEAITTLDGVERRLAPSMLVIADAERPVAIAGVMGGRDTEVTEGTTEVLIESANFNQVSIRRTSRSLNLRSEASHRFERGIDPERTVPAVDRAAQLMAQLGGGEILVGVADCFPRPTPRRAITVAPADTARLLGVRYTTREITAALRRLEFDCEAQGDEVVVTPPTFRRDVTEKADLVEEVARIYGYESIPTTLPSGQLPEPARNWAWDFENQLRGLLAGAGLAEAITYPLVSATLHDRLVAPGFQLETAAPSNLSAASRLPSAIKVANPMTPEQECLRLTLAGSLLQTLAHNVRFNQGGMGFFEIGRAYWPVNGGLRPSPGERPEGAMPCDERRLLAGLIYGEWQAQEWTGPARVADFFDLKGVLEVLAEALEITFGYAPIRHPTFHPGQAALLTLEAPGTLPGSPPATRIHDEGPPSPATRHAPSVTASEPSTLLLRLPFERLPQPGPAPAATPIGVAGRVHPAVAAGFDLERPCYLFEIDLQALLPLAERVPRFHPLSRFPALHQDLAFVVDEAVPAAALERVIESEATDVVQVQARLFDVYRGAPVPAHRKSLAFAVSYQSAPTVQRDGTLTDEEVRPIRERIVQRARQELGAELR